MEPLGWDGILPGIMDLVGTVKRMVPYEVKQFYWAALAVWQSPTLWALLAVAFVWERWRPADPAQPLLSRGLGQDFLWFNLDIAVNIALIPAFAGGLRLLYDSATGGRHFPVVAHWPVVAQVVLTVFVVDLLFFLKHWMIHRVGTLWHFHAIHHSQRELNVMTDRRQHVFEHVVSHVFVFLPAFIIGLKPYSVMTISAALWFHSFLIHGNIRTNFGWLGQVVISPQYHRIHHSIEPRHRDKNFGTIITLWDRVFGTRYPGTDEYPGTGVEGVEFPPPRSLKPQAWLADMARQLWYPFSKVLKLR